MRGKIYGVGVGPGDPELMTLKAVRLIRENGVVAVPGTTAAESAAYRIAVRAVPELAEKELIAVPMPMTRDADTLASSHRRAAEMLKAPLDEGRDVVYLTLGDPAVYCTFSYIQRLLEADGYETELVSGIPSFCAAAARLGIPLAEGNEELHVLPGGPDRACGAARPAALSGTCVFMKSGRSVGAVREMLRMSGRDVYMVENCGMDGERIFRSADAIPDDAGYFSLIVAKERR